MKNSKGKDSSNEFIIELDYTVVPLKLTVTPSKQFQQQADFDDLDSSFQEKIRQNTKGQMVLPTFPNGSVPVMLLQPVSLPK